MSAETPVCSSKLYPLLRRRFNLRLFSWRTMGSGRIEGKDARGQILHVDPMFQQLCGTEAKIDMMWLGD